MSTLTPQQKKNIERAFRIATGGEIAIVKYLEELEARIDAMEMKGEKGDRGERGDDGKDYALTESDKREIAKKVAPLVKVPVVEKVIETIREPIIKKEIVKEIKQDFDSTPLEEKIESVKKELEGKIGKTVPRIVVGGAGPQIYSDGTKVGTKTRDINFTGATVTDEYGRIKVAISGGSSGSGAPGTTPTSVGQIYIDTSTTPKNIYISTGTSSSADWYIIASYS